MKQAMTPEEIKEKKPYLDWSLTEHEYDYICDKLLKRLPNYTEIGLFSAMWSEHCSYKKSKPVLRLFPTKGKRVVQGPGEGAGVVDIDDGQAVVFKAESHNHPTTVEPYQGAATGVGGILRDVFSMGARPVAILDSLHFGELKNNPTMRYKMEETIRGVGDYGNCIGIPNLGGETTFDSCYNGNILLNAMCVGLMNIKDMEHGKAVGLGNSIMYVGAKTGRDGIHGATFASADFSKEHETQRSAVQVGDPFMEKLLMEACLELILKHRDWLVGFQDMGAAGIVSSSAEMATEGNAGMELNLDLVPQREPNMSAYEIMLSESQERMLLCVKKGHEEDVKKIFKDYNLDAVTIGRVIEGENYVLYHEGEKVCDIPVRSLTEDVLEEPSKEIKPQYIIDAEKMPAWRPSFESSGEILKRLLNQPTIANDQFITQQYDSQVRSNTIVKPGSDAGVLRIRHTKKAIAMCTDTNGRFVYLNPKIGGQRSVIESVCNIVASGAKPLAITDCLNYGDPNDPEIFWSLRESCQGIADACRIFETPVVSGNVSLYNENDGQAIYPSPMIGMVGLIKNTDYVIPMHVQEADDIVYLVGKTTADFAGSEVQKMLQGKISGLPEAPNLELIHDYLKNLHKAMTQGLVTSAHDLSEGGLAVSLAESVFDTEFGLNINLSEFDKTLLFSETPGRLIVSVKPENKSAFESLLGSAVQEIGRVTDQRKLSIKLANDELNTDVASLEKIWKESIPCLMKSKA
ncbi:phosphoribosylformylglycinamidine synthase subunit PurL [Lactobacillus helveticus]|uniref:Phosphoribosylformylglycinamidine synthase subunit PurL n=1 Tax=Lactobacillus helveticus TaxID=1587 RepID=A0AAV4E4T7_LACHE|nr:phosphoribosylformylglycinamidine synthase subunit PurL [Lactobacillus helveticus]GFP11712.1 phosphoribosylformylglycinamidine synthase subunit PurL [Lactobacillus helveticus]GFP13261.1 phosphoribosylformylglycinamidine synthase subunit PurL [Lactobacillus helveticus]